MAAQLIRTKGLLAACFSWRVFLQTWRASLVKYVVWRKKDWRVFTADLGLPVFRTGIPCVACRDMCVLMHGSCKKNIKSKYASKNATFQGHLSLILVLLSLTWLTCSMEKTNSQLRIKEDSWWIGQKVQFPISHSGKPQAYCSPSLWSSPSTTDTALLGMAQLSCH